MKREMVGNARRWATEKSLSRARLQSRSPPRTPPRIPDPSTTCTKFDRRLLDIILVVYHNLVGVIVPLANLEW